MLINSQNKLTIKNYYMNRKQNYYTTTSILNAVCSSVFFLRWEDSKKEKKYIGGREKTGTVPNYVD